MLIAKISVTGVRAASTKLGTLTSGMVGAKVQFSFDTSWEGLNKTAVFRCMDITKDVLNIDSEVTVPHEALVRSGSPLYVGVYGTNAADDLVIPTRWATVGIVYSGADPSGDPSTERSPDVWEQLQNQINELKNQGADADAIKQAVDAYMAANPPAESDPTVPEWAKQPNPPAVQLPTTLPNPHKLTFTGAVTAEYDGSKPVEVPIPKPGGIEVTGASVGQIIVVKAVDEKGKPTEWETADLPQGGGSDGMKMELIHDIVVEESVNKMNLDMRKNGQPVYWRYLAFVFVGVFDSPTGKTGSADLQIAKGYNGSEWEQWNVKVVGVFNSAATTIPTTFAFHCEKEAESPVFWHMSRNGMANVSAPISIQKNVKMTDYEYIQLYFPGNSTDYNIGAGTKIKIWGIEG